jgi:hypothetical protein
MDDRQLSIELQSARNAVYSAIGEGLTKLEDKEIASEIFRTWRVTKALEKRALRWVQIQGELEYIKEIEDELTEKKNALKELEQ